MQVEIVLTEELNDAVKQAMEECIEEHILEKFFQERSDEVLHVIKMDLTWEAREPLIRKEEREIL